MRQGDVDGRGWFLVYEGELVVEVDGCLVAELRRGSQFGERSLLRGAPRAATVRAVTDVILYSLSPADFLGSIGGVETQAPRLSDSSQPIEPLAALAHAPLTDSLPSATLAGLVERSWTQEVARAQ